MKNKATFKQIILSFILSVVCGSLTGGMVFLFKYAASFIIRLSSMLYQFVRENPLYLPLLILIILILSLFLFLIIKVDSFCKGGGIVTSIDIIKNNLPFRWFFSVLLLPIAAFITFFSGVPLGNEGPSVQMGCALGKFTLNFVKKDRDILAKHIESGGMGAGFASVTGAPLSALVFAFEEIRLGFSPLMIISVLTAVFSSFFVSHVLGKLLNFHIRLFDIKVNEVLSYKYLWIVIVLGIAVGLLSVLFIKLYHFAEKLLNENLKKLPDYIKFILVFVITAILGFVSKFFIGTGYDLIIDVLSKVKNVWYMLLVALVVRAILIAFSNKTGITGGLFIPTLTLGAIIGYLFAELFAFIGFLPEQYYLIIIIISICSFLGATTKIPITAFVFALEIFCVGYNAIYVLISISLAFLVVKIFDIKKHIPLNIKHKA